MCMPRDIRTFDTTMSTTKNGTNSRNPTRKASASSVTTKAGASTIRSSREGCSSSSRSGRRARCWKRSTLWDEALRRRNRRIGSLAAEAASRIASARAAPRLAAPSPPWRWGRASSWISSHTGAMTYKVKMIARPLTTVLEGTCGVPTACLRMPKTTLILAKDVTLTKRKGSSESRATVSISESGPADPDSPPACSAHATKGEQKKAPPASVAARGHTLGRGLRAPGELLRLLPGTEPSMLALPSARRNRSFRPFPSAIGCAAHDGGLSWLDERFSRFCSLSSSARSSLAMTRPSRRTAMLIRMSTATRIWTAMSIRMSIRTAMATAT